MGLDVYAGFCTLRKSNQKTLLISEKILTTEWRAPYYWRKHARLQQYMTELWHKKNGTEMLGIMGPDGFNGGDVLRLTRRRHS